MTHDSQNIPTIPSATESSLAWLAPFNAAIETSDGHQKPLMAFLGPDAQALGTLNDAMECIEHRISSIWSLRHRQDQADPFSWMTGWSLENGMIKAEGVLRSCSCCGPDSASTTFPQALLALDDTALATALKVERQARDDEKRRTEAMQAEQDAQEQRQEQASAEQARRALYDTLRAEYGDVPHGTAPTSPTA